MRAPAREEVQGALEPLRAELLRAARADATSQLADAERDAMAVLDDARSTATAILDEARRQGEADGADAAAAAATRARRDARGRDLAVRAESYEELRARVIERVRQLRRTPDYPGVRDRLTDLARRMLGPDAAVAEHPDGGVVGRCPGRRVDLTLGTLAARALDRAGAEVEHLWTP